MNTATLKMTVFRKGEELSAKTEYMSQERAKKRMAQRIASFKEQGYHIFNAVFAVDMYLQFSAMLIDNNNEPVVLHTYEVEL